MSDNHTVYRRIKQGLLQLYPKQLTGNQARHLNTLTGLVSGNELIGGIWALPVSWVALRTGGLNKALNYLGLGLGTAGILSIIPPLTEIGVTIFGLGMIVWFAWVGIVLLRSSSGVVAEPAESLSRRSTTA